MKKLLSIICTLALVLSVVLVPGMFSATAAGELSFSVVKTTDGITASEGVYSLGNSWADNKMYTNFVLQAGKTYNITFNTSVDNYSSCGISVMATSDPTGATITEGGKVKLVYNKANKNIDIVRPSVNFNADDIIDATNKYLGLVLNSASDGSAIKNIVLREVPTDDYVDLVGTEEHGYIGVDEDGNNAFITVPYYGRQYGTYDYEINPDKYYKITYEYKGKNGVDGGTQFIWQTSSDKDPADSTLPAATVGVNHPVGNVDVANYTAYSITAKGSALGADATHKYLTIRGNSVVAKACYFRKLQVTEIEKPFFTAYGGVLNMYTVTEGEDTYNEYGIPANDTLGAGWGDDNYMTSDFVLEANSAYLVTYDWKGHNYDTPLYFAITNSPNAGFKANYKTPATKTSNKTSYKSHGAIFYTGDKVTDEYKYFGMCIRDFGGDPYLVRNIKIEKIDLATAGTLLPSAQTGTAFVRKDAAGAYELYLHAWTDKGSYTFDQVIDPAKNYKLSFSFKGANRAGDVDGGLANRFSLRTNTSTGAVGFDAAQGAVIDVIPQVDNQWGYFDYEYTFKGSDIGATAESKYLVLQFGYYYTNCSFKNIKLEEISPADYSAVDKAIEDAGKLDKNAYKDFSGVDAAIAAVVRDKDSSEQAAVDAMAKAINDAIAALEVKTADYSAVDAAIAAAQALNPGDYNNWYKVARAIYAVKRDLTAADQATIDGYATAINDAIAALVEDDKYDYPINLGSDININNKISVEDGTGDIVYSVPGSYGYKATLYFDFEMKAGKYYSITFNYKGDGKGAKGDWRVVGAADNWNGVNTVTQYDALPNYRSQALPRLDKNAADMTEWGTVGMIVKADALINGDNKFIAISNGTTDNGDALVKNITIKEVTLPEGVLYPAALSNNAKLAWEDGLVVGQFGGEDPSKISNYGYSYGRVFVAYDYTIDANKTYTITFDYKGHNYSDVGKLPYFGVAKLEGIGTGEDPASYVRSVNAGVPTSKTAWVPVSKTVTGAELLAGAPEGANKFIIHMGGMISGANFRNLKIAEYVAPTDADYTAVDAAIAAANALTKANYVDFSAVDAAIAAVVRGKTVDEQAAVDAMAKAITDAIDALVMKGADYTAVNNAKAAAEALDKNLYKDFSAVDAAIAAIVTGKEVDEQDEVDAMAKAITDAVAALEYKDADYSEIEELDNLLHTMNGTLYTDATVQAVRNALNAIEDGKNITEQTQVDAWADALRAAIDALEKKPADYSAVDAAIAAAEALDADDYTNYDDVEAAIDAVEEGKKIDEQDEVDAWARAITAAIDALVEKADYSEIDEIEAQYPDFNPADYTEESLAALYAVIEKIEANNNLPATEQDKVDELAEEFAAALKALVRKPAQDGGNSSTGSTGNNTTEKAPDKTGDSSNIFVAIIAMVVSVLGLAVLVIAKKRRA